MAPTALTDSSNASQVDETIPRVLVPEKLSPDGLNLLTEAGFEVDNRPGLAAQELLSLIPSYHALIVRSETKVNSEVLSAGSRLKVVARAGVGVDNIDIQAATSYGIIVVNSPAGNIAAAAEHTIALLLATARNVGRADASVKAKKWERSKLVGIEVGSKTLGLVGLGKVGMKVARMAIGLGMKVVAVDPYMSADVAKQNGVKMVEGLQDLLPHVDFLTIHTPLLASTLNLLGEKEFQTMKRTARVLNVARGGIYNEEALIKALDEGWIAGAGIDVFTSEPPEPGSSAEKLTLHSKVVSTPHLGASTVEAQENVSLDVCNQVAEILRGGLPSAAVNAPLILPEEYRKLQPFVRLVERLGDLYTQHFVGGRGGMVGGRKFELIYHGELAGVSNTRPLLAALIKGLTSSISDSGGRDVNIVNAQLIAKEKGIAINETHAREESKDVGYASLVTLRSYDSNQGAEQIIEGYVSGQAFYISKLGRFSANFVPEGTMILLHNYDEPGKIGNVGIILGTHKVNITFMQVASLDRAVLAAGDGNGAKKRKGENEALMILGVDGDVTSEVLEALRQSDGILDVNLVKL
ncbi:phosphoglycerate dehydrogenase [Cryphonectria parasitica EP155]|uniref:D-3-phosphoglycerate dehydrogenase n=1 Tax=Cryphonectria parasitica (strain ATCC 38755 / EP155) TaxID=660469 RepID=A0A9P4XU24_CRYP1|nr:phosphoglycerate dehydrogenase [Cryphonectria parasitica EP155]KAF3761257.1 phosphoglycerate dehydrogenase [Cryphonectria parasitica EP155]